MPDSVRVRLVGVAPLLMHNGRLADPMDEYARALARVTRKRMKTDADHAAIARIEWMGGLWVVEGRPCVPGEAIEACIVAAAKTRRAGPAARAGVVVEGDPRLAYEGPADLDRLYGEPAFVHRVGVRVAGRTTIRTRPRFDAWRLEATISFLPSLVDRSTLLEHLAIAGALVGLGDHRPRYGRFRAEVA